jgi:hypothetical protein
MKTHGRIPSMEGQRAKGQGRAKGKGQRAEGKDKKSKTGGRLPDRDV